MEVVFCSAWACFGETHSKCKARPLCYGCEEWRIRSEEAGCSGELGPGDDDQSTKGTTTTIYVVKSGDLERPHFTSAVPGTAVCLFFLPSFVFFCALLRVAASVALRERSFVHVIFFAMYLPLILHLSSSGAL